MLTVDAARPVADGFVVEGGRFLAVGGRAELAGLLGPADQVVDLGGQTVVPGLIDAHVHFSLFSFGLTDLNLDGADSLEAALALVRERAARTAPGTWIRGMGFNANTWGRWPTRQDLDGVAPDHFVILWNKDVHSIWVNS
ncbi:MAG: Amidohydrolase 3, partial [Firmicutes bacterium]|nr:Amidohydrolase 3 [Bacillota bacterium]